MKKLKLFLLYVAAYGMYLVIPVFFVVCGVGLILLLQYLGLL